MKILLTALSAKHIHKTLAPWCLKAYCDAHVEGVQIEVQEHTVNDPVRDIVAELFLHRPDIVGFSCYIWNIEHVVKVATMLKQYLPACRIILGGPEMSFEADCNAYPFAHAIVQGVGEVSFAALIRGLIAGTVAPGTLIPSCDAAPFDAFPSPYTPAYFSSFQEGRMVSVKNQLVYYESTRGCPFSCSYCLTSTSRGVQELPLRRVFSELDNLLQHGAMCIKFVDRTFNANRGRALEILRYVLSLDTDCTFHFEAAADLFDSESLELISKMPPARVQFEIGIQSIHPATLSEVKRNTDTKRALQNIQTLTSYGNCHVHVDLIAGLPRETPGSFAAGINACIQAHPHMLQLGFLKLLKGTAIRANHRRYGYVFNGFPPYEALRNDTMCFEDMIQLRRIEAVIDKFYNSGAFANTVNHALGHVFHDPYSFFAALADFCGRDNLKISLKHAYTMLLRFLCKHMDKALAEHYIKLDCLTFSSKNVLPDGITRHRDKAAEHAFRRDSFSRYRNVRAEFFAYDSKTRIFIYDEKDAITNAYKVIALPQG